MSFVKIRKYYKQQVSQIDGPKEKLNFLGPKTEISEIEAREILDRYFESHPKQAKAQKVKCEAWTLILKGESISVNKTCISSKTFQVSEKRIAART